MDYRRYLQDHERERNKKARHEAASRDGIREEEARAAESTAAKSAAPALNVGQADWHKTQDPLTWRGEDTAATAAILAKEHEAVTRAEAYKAKLLRIDLEIATTVKRLFKSNVSVW